MKTSTTRIVNGIFLVLGVGLLVSLLVRLDLIEVWGRIRGVGWFFLLSVTSAMLGLVTSAAAWQVVIDRDRSKASYRHLLGAFWFGHAVNYLTPMATAGEVLRATVLRGRVEPDELVASLISYSFFNTVSMAIFSLLGPLLCIVFLDLPPRVIYTILALAVLSMLPLALLYLCLRLGAIKQLARFVGWLPLLRRYKGALEKRAAAIDAAILAFTQRGGDFRRAMFWMLLARLMPPLEAWALLHCFLPQIGAWDLLVIAMVSITTSQLLSWAISIVPGQLGFAEGGMTLLFKLLGLDPLAGFSMELVRRIRQIVIVAVGLTMGFLMIREAKTRPEGEGQDQAQP